MVASPQEVEWLIVGAEGQLAQSMRNALVQSKVSLMTRTRLQLDITDSDQIQDLLHEVLPRVIFNGAAWTNVEAAETAEDEATLVNAQGAAYLARLCAQIKATLVHISTDFVFSGVRDELWEESAILSPVSAYGRSKAAGEKAVLETPSLDSYVVRTAWLYGSHGKNFARTILRKALTESGEISVVNDQFGQPTFSDDLAEQIFRMVDRKVPFGIYHGTNSGQATWYEFAREIFRLAGQDERRVKPIYSESYPSSVMRPAYSVLGHAKWNTVGMTPMRDWKLALREAMPGLLLQLKVEE